MVSHVLVQSVSAARRTDCFRQAVPDWSRSSRESSGADGGYGKQRRLVYIDTSRKLLIASFCDNVVVCVDVGSTIYEGSDESKSKSGSTDSHGSTRQSSSSTSSSRSAHSTTSAAITHNGSAAVSSVLPPWRASVTEDVVVSEVK